MGTAIVFYILSAAIIICSSLVVILKNPIHAAVALVIDLFLLAGVYAFQGAEFAAAIQVIVYAGAIVVLFMFVIMILNLDFRSIQEAPHSKIEYFLFATIFCGFIALCYYIWPNAPSNTITELTQRDNTYEVAMKLFTKYLWPFELASILILLAIVASVVIVSKKQKINTRKKNS